MSPDHAYFMRRALSLAMLGQGRVNPNPKVGCVVVKNNRIIAEGFHAYFGGPHAELVALRKAGLKARGATIYLTLEPCTHWGKTPPCAPHVIDSGIKSAYIAMKDPNPVVSGKGIRALRNAGIQVHLGLEEASARQLNRAFITWKTLKRPYVILKWAMTLDGKTATPKGKSKWITNPQARRIGHLLRSESDAILVGRKTVDIDNPHLTSHGLGRNPLRFVLDPHLKIKANAHVNNVKEAETMIISSRPHSLQKSKYLKRRGVQILIQSLKYGKFELKKLLNVMAKYGVSQLLVEGGGNTHWNFIEQGFADEIFAFIAPKILGGEKAFPAVGGSGFSSLQRSLELNNVSISQIDDNILVHGFSKKAPHVLRSH